MLFELLKTLSWYTIKNYCDSKTSVFASDVLTGYNILMKKAKKSSFLIFFTQVY